MTKTKIDTAGHWLNPAAAASYARMRANGMPAGGIAAAGRTFAQQLALWLAYLAGRGNLATNPRKGTSMHQLGRALDITRTTKAHDWATQGGTPLTVKTSECILANDHGWYRTVPTEAWHFAYYPDKDRWRQPTLKTGSTGPWVKALQRALGITPDGRYGPRTAATVRAWQKAHRLTPDGKAGPKTLTALGITHI